MSVAQGAKGMIFLETEHPIIKSTLLEKLAPGAKQEPCDITCSDFDDVRYRMVVTGDAKNVIKFQLSMPYLRDLNGLGASALLDSMYGAYKSSGSEKGYDTEFKIDVDKQRESAETVAKNFAEIKRNLTAAPFKRCFEALAKGSSSSLKPMVIPFRPAESMILVPSSDRVLVFFTVYFSDETDRAIAKVFLQEFSETNRKIPNAPSVAFTTDCPSDLGKVREFRAGKEDLVGYVQFQIFQSHVEGAKLDKLCTLLSGFRAYIHYHIKASKAHLHSRMRHRVDLLLKVLKRADPTAGDESAKKAFRTYQ